MAQCTVCRNFFPPGFTIVTEDGKATKCLFCERGVLDLEYIESETGQKKLASKFEIIREYQKYINELADNKEIKNLILEDMIKKGMQQ
jgi:hypothetical protein